MSFLVLKVILIGNVCICVSRSFFLALSYGPVSPHSFPRTRIHTHTHTKLIIKVQRPLTSSPSQWSSNLYLHNVNCSKRISASLWKCQLYHDKNRFSAKSSLCFFISPFNAGNLDVSAFWLHNKQQRNVYCHYTHFSQRWRNYYELNIRAVQLIEN